MLKASLTLNIMALKGIKQTQAHIAKRVASYKSHPRRLQDLTQKLLSKVVKRKGCWIWTGSVFRKKYGNYGQIRIGRIGEDKVYRAHRVSYEHFIGPIPEGLELDHLCHNTLCINVEHLEPVTHAENMKRRKDSGLARCKHGHRYTTESTYINTRGRRECKTCRKIRVTNFYKRRSLTKKT